jgi:hypothetical protein
MSSAEKVRFLTGTQRVITPSCDTLKSGLQVKSALTALAGVVKFAQMLAFATFS